MHCNNMQHKLTCIPKYISCLLKVCQLSKLWSLQIATTHTLFCQSINDTNLTDTFNSNYYLIYICIKIMYRNKKRILNDYIKRLININFI